MIIDSHHHLWDIARGYSWLDAPELASIRRTFDVDDLKKALPDDVRATVLVEGGRCEAYEAFEHLRVAHETPRIAGVVAWADVTEPELPRVIGEYSAAPGGQKLVGIRSQIQGEPDDDILARADVHRGLAVVADAGLAFDLVVRASQLPAAVVAARAVPQARLVLDHLGKPPVASGSLEPWRSAVADLAACPNVVAKLSGLVTEADHESWQPADLRPFIDTALDLFGPNRLMFGSDWPVCTLAASYGQVVDVVTAAVADLSADEQRSIWADTAVKAYHLSGIELG